MDPPLALGLEIGGTKLQAGVAGPDGKFVGFARRRVDPARGGAGIREEIPALLDEAVGSAAVPWTRVKALGVGFGGPVDSGAGRVVVSHQVEGWEDFPLREWLEKLRGIPVLLQNDCKAAAYGEATLGAGRGRRRIFYVTVGSGIGGGLVTDGAVDAGQGLGAGEVGHTWVPHPATGEPEKLELVASGWSIERRAREALEKGRPTALRERCGGNPSAVTARVVYEAAEANDPLARAILEETCDALGIGIANVIALLCPERVIVGGGVSLMGPLFWETLRARVRDYAFKPFAGRTEIVPAELGEDVVVTGALLLALRAATT